MEKRHVWIGLAMIAAVGLLAGCGQGGATAVPADAVPIVAREAEGAVVAEASIAPARSSELWFEIAGDVIAVLVQEGDAVAAGDPLVQLETDDLERALARAELSLQQAQVQLEQLEDPPDERDVQVARTAVEDAQVAYDEALVNLRVVQHRLSAREEVEAAQVARDEAYRVYQNIQVRFDDQEKYINEDMVTNARDAYLNAEDAYQRALENASLQLTSARNGVTRAENALEQAANELEDLLEGSDEDDVAAVRLSIEAAQLALEAARDDLADAVLVAPFDGVIAGLEVDPGDTVASAQVVIVLATLDQLQARTTDLTELDVVRVKVGQQVKVTVDALPGEDFAGEVTEIALRPGDYRGDVVYEVTIDLSDAANERLRWGMTALVEIDTR